MRSLSLVPLLRRVVLPLLRRFNPGDISIRHAYTGDPVRLHSYRHKGYWFHGRRWEQDTMWRYPSLISPGQVVFDVGGHIGYAALYFAQLVGPGGQVHVFEPGPNNLPYTRRNLAPRPNVNLVEAGVGDAKGRLTLNLEDLTGQNNSFLQNFHMLKRNEASHFASAGTRGVEVEVITLDSYVETAGVQPAFIKVDVEGFELNVLQGASSLLRTAPPILMVEVQMNQEELLALLTAAGYRVFTSELEPIHTAAQLGQRAVNTFCFHERHDAILQALGVAR